MARRSQCSSAGDNPLDPNYLPPHYREEYRLAVDALVENSLDGYYEFLHKADVVDFLSTTEIKYIENVVQIPKHINQPEQYFLESGSDGSSDTYWPVHSDLDIPGLDLGWPQVHAFIEPTEITTLLNPPEPDMPSIKEHARRLIRSAQQVVAVVMDMFTDVDMFLEVLNAASRRVAVYIVLDEINSHHFANMVVNCRVNLQDFQFLRVRTVSGITYQCRSGKSFKGQMLDRFLLTDCRAVLSGNYSFMWSFEKLHRCMAHLFLGQFVTTFDEEFRILYAQSQPLTVEDVLAPMEDLNIMPKPQYPNESSLMYREPRKFLPPDSGHPNEWRRHSNEERMEGDWRSIELKQQDSLRGPGDMYNRFATPQSRMEPCFDQGLPRNLMTENPALKRHSYAEGAQGRYNFPFVQQQGMPEPELKGKPFYRGQHPYPAPGQESDYSSYDKFWNQDYLSTDQYVEPGLPQGEPPHDNFDPVLNYLSSTRNRDFDQSSEQFQQPSHPNRLNLVQPYVHQTSPTPSNSDEQKQFLQDATANRKDPNVKQGLRNWRISSYLSTYDNPEEEGLSSSELCQAPDAFEEPSNPTQGMGVTLPKKANFKVPAAHRISQMASYAKASAQEKPKKYLEEPVPGVVEIRVTPTPSECSSTHEGEKMEEEEQKETANPLLRRDDSFRRKYSSAMQRSSRLRSSLIYSSLEQQPAPQETTTATQHEEERDKNQTDQTKLPFVAHMLGQRKSAVREPFEWSRYLKSATEAPRTDDGSSKADDSSKKDDSKDVSEKPKAKESIKLPEVGRDTPSPSLPQPKPSEVEFSKTDQPAPLTKSLQSGLPYVDMNDPDMRFMFFKELAAKRKAEKEKEKAQTKSGDSNTGSIIQKEESPPKKTSESIKGLTSERSVVPNPASKSAEKAVPTEASESASLSVDDSKNANTKDSVPNRDSNISNTVGKKETKLSEKLKVDMTLVQDFPNLAETEPGRRKSLHETPVFLKESPSVPQSKPSEPQPPKTDQPVQPTTTATNQPAQPTKPKIKSPLYMDMSDPDSRFLFFKELAAKRKAEKEKAQMKPEADSNTGPVVQKEEPLPKKTSENMKGLTSEGLIVLNTASTSAGKAVTIDTSESASLSVDDSKNANTKDSVTNRDSNLSNTDVAKETKILEKLKLNMKSVEDLTNLAETESERRKSLQETPVFIKDSLTVLRSDPSESQPPKTDQPVQPTTSAINQPAKPKLISPLYMDMSDPHNRLMFFKELAAKRKDAKAAEAEKEKANVQIKPQMEPKNAPTVQKEEPPAKETSDSLKSSTKEALVAKAAAEETMTRDDTNTKNSAFNSEQETKLPISAKPESCLSKSLEEQVVSSPFATENDNSTKNATPADVSCLSQGTDERQSSTSESTSKNLISALPNSEESTFSPALNTDTGNLESIQLEPSPSLPSEPDTRSELSSSKPLVQSSSSDSPVLNSDSQNSPSITEEMSFSDSSPDVSSSTHAPDTPQRAQESLIPSSQEFSQSRCLEKPDSLSRQTHLDTVYLLESPENTPAADSVNVESDISPSGPETNTLNGSRNLEELPAATPSMEGSETVVPESGKEELIAEVCKVPGSSQDVTDDCTSAVGLSLPESSQDLSGLESSSSKHNLEEIVTLDLPWKHSPSESVENTDVDPVASPSEMTLSPQCTPAQTALTLNLNLTDSDAPNPAGAEQRSLTEPDKSVSSPEIKETETILPTLDTNIVTIEAESRTEKSPVHQSTQSESCSSESTSKHPAEADLPCKTSESQSSEPTEERREKQPSVDEKASENLEDTKKSKVSGTQDSVNSEINQNNCSQSAETAPKQPKVNQSRYHSSTANVLSSSNLRDDTKLLLEQISANCQSRNEATKESPAVTDDEKEDKAEKNAKNELGRRFRGVNKDQPPTQEQKKLIDRIQSMRKERRVYSRFEMTS